MRLFGMLSRRWRFHGKSEVGNPRLIENACFGDCVKAGVFFAYLTGDISEKRSEGIYGRFFFRRWRFGLKNGREFRFITQVAS